MHYNYCPNCGFKARNKKNATELWQCQFCKFIAYNNPKPVVVGVILNSVGEILLTQRKFKPFQKYWSLPAGFMKAGETPEESLKRELFEELGIKVKIKKVLHLDKDWYSYKNVEVVKIPLTIIVFSLEILGSKKIVLVANDDISAFRWFAKKKLPAQIAFHWQRKFLKSLGY